MLFKLKLPTNSEHAAGIREEGLNKADSLLTDDIEWMNGVLLPCPLVLKVIQLVVEKGLNTTHEWALKT